MSFSGQGVHIFPWQYIDAPFSEVDCMFTYLHNITFLDQHPTLATSILLCDCCLYVSRKTRHFAVAVVAQLGQ